MVNNEIDFPFIILLNNLISYISNALIASLFVSKQNDNFINHYFLLYIFFILKNIFYYLNKFSIFIYLLIINYLMIYMNN